MITRKKKRHEKRHFSWRFDAVKRRLNFDKRVKRRLFFREKNKFRFFFIVKKNCYKTPLNIV